MEQRREEQEEEEEEKRERRKKSLRDTEEVTPLLCQELKVTETIDGSRRRFERIENVPGETEASGSLACVILH